MTRPCPEVVERNQRTIQVDRRDAEHRTGDRRRQAYLHDVGALNGRMSRASVPEPGPGDNAAHLPLAGSVGQDRHAVTEAQEQHHRRVRDDPDRPDRPDSKPSHGDTDNLAWPLRTCDVPLSRVGTSERDGPHAPMIRRPNTAAGTFFQDATAHRGDSGLMTITDDKFRLKGSAGAPEELLLLLSGGQIYVCEDGPHDAPTLLLIHGSAASSRSWEPLVRLLTGAYRIIRIDLPGCGRSAEPAGGDYAIPEQGRRVGEALDRLGVKRAIVVGHSSGGLVATALAEQRPSLVTALALIDTGPGMDAFIGPDTGALGPAQWPPTQEQARRLARSAFSREDYEIPQAFVDDVRGMDFAVFAATMRAGNEYLTQQVAPDRLKALGKPLLVIFGTLDRRWRPSSAFDYRVVPGARVEMLSGVGHSPNLEDPPRTAAVLLAFTASHVAPDGDS